MELTDTAMIGKRAKRNHDDGTADGFNYGIEEALELSHKCAALRSTNGGVTVAIYRQLAEPDASRHD